MEETVKIVALILCVAFVAFSGGRVVEYHDKRLSPECEWALAKTVLSEGKVRYYPVEEKGAK